MIFINFTTYGLKIGEKSVNIFNKNAKNTEFKNSTCIFKKQ